MLGDPPFILGALPRILYFPDGDPDGLRRQLPQGRDQPDHQDEEGEGDVVVPERNGVVDAAVSEGGPQPHLSVSARSDILRLINPYVNFG